MASTVRPTTARCLTLPLRPSSSSSRSQTFTQIQCRHASTNRRGRKMLNTPPAPGMSGPTLPTGSSGRSRTALNPIPEVETIIYNPPSSMPNVYHTPPKFLPKSDIRWKLFEQAQRQQHTSSKSKKPASAAPSPAAQASPDNLPPPVRSPYAKRYHLTPADMDEMRALRKSDEEKWTRSRLAERFQCSQNFVGMVVPASKERKEKLARMEDDWADWARRKNPALLKIRADRVKRKGLWAVEA